MFGKLEKSAWSQSACFNNLGATLCKWISAFYGSFLFFFFSPFVELIKKKKKRRKNPSEPEHSSENLKQLRGIITSRQIQMCYLGRGAPTPAPLDLAAGWINALEELEVHFITVQGSSALKILIYTAAAKQGGRQVEALKEKRQRRASAVSVFTLE